MRVIMSCAGTGGHIYPAIAIADRIKAVEPDSEIMFIGTREGMENRLVKDAGYEIRGIDASGFNRRNLLKNFKTLSDMIKGRREVDEILDSFKPDIVFGTGGYVTGNVIKEAHRRGIRTYIHEQNAIPGLANKMLEEFADKVFISFDSSREHFRHKDKLVLSGNPIRSSFSTLDRADCRSELGIADGEFLILAFGGSLGADILNKAVVRLIDELPDQGIKLYFVTGKRYYDGVLEMLKDSARTNFKLIPYADNMPVLMKASDLVISRSGAIAVSEITAAGRPSILVPSPNVTNNHQYYNAKAVADAGAALLIQETDMGEDYSSFTARITKLIGDGGKLEEMERAALAIGRSDAADIICENIR